MSDAISSSEALPTLSQHHERIQDILTALVQSSDDDRDQLVYELFVELRVHSILEQQLFFPAISSLISREQITRCGSDFYVMLALMLELEQIEPEHELFDKNLRTIAERFAKHVKDLETTIVPEIVQANVLDLEALSERLAERRKELQEKMRTRMKPRRRDEQPGFVPPVITKYIRCA